MTTKRKIVVALLLLFTVSAAGSTALLAYQAKKMVHLMDLNNSGTLEFYEVGPLIREKFAQFDKDGDAKLSQMEVTRYVLSGLVQGLSNSIKDKGPQIVSASDVVSLKDLQAALNEMVVALELPGATFVAGKNGKECKRKINPTPALRQNLCASGVGIPLPLTDQENPGYDLIRKCWENGSQRLTRRAVETSRARSTGQIRESGYVERKGDREVPCFFSVLPERSPPAAPLPGSSAAAITLGAVALWEPE